MLIDYICKKYYQNYTKFVKIRIKLSNKTLLGKNKKNI